MIAALLPGLLSRLPFKVHFFYFKFGVLGTKIVLASKFWITFRAKSNEMKCGNKHLMLINFLKNYSDVNFETFQSTTMQMPRWPVTTAADKTCTHEAIRGLSIYGFMDSLAKKVCSKNQKHDSRVLSLTRCCQIFQIRIISISTLWNANIWWQYVHCQLDGNAKHG